MTTPAKPNAGSVQIELFDSWFATSDEGDNSRTLAFWDVIPWRLLSHNRKGKLPEVIAFEGVRIDDRHEATVVIDTSNSARSRFQNLEGALSGHPRRISGASLAKDGRP